LATDALTTAAEWIAGQRLPIERRLDRLGTYLSQKNADKESTP
jgi:hypothetical protein